MASYTTAAQAAQETLTLKLVTSNHNLCCLLHCRDVMGNMKGAAFGGRRQLGNKGSQVVGHQVSLMALVLEHLNYRSWGETKQDCTLVIRLGTCL